MEKLKVKDVKEMLSNLNDEEYFEFRLNRGQDYYGKEINVPLEIRCRGFQCTNPITNYITLEEQKKEVKNKEVLPIMFMFDMDLFQVTRIVYVDGSVEYKENRITKRFENSWPPDSYR